MLIFDEALKPDRLILVREGAEFRMKALDGNVVTAGVKREDYGLTALPMRHLSPERKIVPPSGFAAPEGTIWVSRNDEMILMRASCAVRKNIVSIAQSRGMYLVVKPNSGIACPPIVPANQVAADLAVMASNDLQASNRSTTVIRRPNVNLLQSGRRKKFRCAMQWIWQLDRTDGAAGGHITADQMQHPKVSDLSGILLTTYGKGGGGTIATEISEPWPSPVGTQLPCPPAGAAALSAMAAQAGGDTPFSQTNFMNLLIHQDLAAVISNHLGAACLTLTLRQRSIATRVAVYDRKTVPLGCLTAGQESKERNKLFGSLTKVNDTEKNRNELLVFITPHVVRNLQNLSDISQQQLVRMPQMSGR